MPIIKRRLDICGREKTWEYKVECLGELYEVNVRQMGNGAPQFFCSCGATNESEADEKTFYQDFFAGPCSHIAEVQRDLSIARQAAAQMIP